VLCTSVTFSCALQFVMMLKMHLECLIVTRDPTLLAHIKSSMSGASLDFRQDSASAIELAGRRHWDGLVIDCDDMAGGAEALTCTRNSRSNRHTPILAVVNGSTSVETALDLGANLAICKPVGETRWRSILDVAIPEMEREHRRYFRYKVKLPVRFRNQLGQSFTATMKNVSEGGMAIKRVDPARLNGVVTVEFEPPSVMPQPFHAKADVVWSDSSVIALRFLYMEKNSGVALQAWLSSLETQNQLRESAVHPC
jgi:DNA-binding NarL/FixJ family response regulator